MAEIFKLFLEQQVLPYCTLYPRPRSILILDNALIYKSARLRDLCKEHGVLLVFLPLYLPDYNCHGTGAIAIERMYSRSLQDVARSIIRVEGVRR